MLQLQVVAHVPRVEQVVHTLEGVNDVNLVVIWVVLKISISDLRGKTYESRDAEVEIFVEIVHVADLVHHELNTVTWSNSAEVKSVKSSFFDLLQGIV
jgi:hypothetical protein